VPYPEKSPVAVLPCKITYRLAIKAIALPKEPHPAWIIFSEWWSQLCPSRLQFKNLANTGQVLTHLPELVAQIKKFLAQSTLLLFNSEVPINEHFNV
jgi:hypothetical protein